MIIINEYVKLKHQEQIAPRVKKKAPFEELFFLNLRII